MILVTIKMILPPRKHDEALKILRSVAEKCTLRPGCLECQIYGDLRENNILIYTEMWRSGEDLEYHLRSEEYQDVLLVMEMALQQPEIRFDTIASSAGIETIEKARSSIHRF